MISFISSFENIKLFEIDVREATSQRRPDSNMFLRIATSVSAAVGVNPSGIKTLLARGSSAFFIKGNQFLVVVLKGYLKILLNVLLYAIEFLIILY